MPDYAEAHYNLGVAWAEQDATEQARASFGEAARRRPEKAWWRLRREILWPPVFQSDLQIDECRQRLTETRDRCAAIVGNSGLGSVALTTRYIEPDVDVFASPRRPTQGRPGSGGIAVAEPRRVQPVEVTVLAARRRAHDGSPSGMGNQQSGAVRVPHVHPSLRQSAIWMSTSSIGCVRSVVGALRAPNAERVQPALTIPPGPL